MGASSTWNSPFLVSGDTMKHFLLLLALISIPAMALQNEYGLNTATTNLATTYPNAPQLTGFTQITTVQVYNGTSQTIEVNCSSGTVKPSTCPLGSGLCLGSFHVIAGATVSSPVGVSLSSSCFVRADSSLANTGTFFVIGWGW